MKKIASYLVLSLSVTILLASCGSNTENSSQTSSRQANQDEVVGNHASVENYELSEALPKYKLWYVFDVIDNKMIQKDSEPAYMLYFDEKNVTTYCLDYDNDSTIFSTVERLPISKLLDKSHEEQLEYAQSFLKVTTIESAVEVVDMTATNSPETPETPFSLNITTDGTGNNTDTETIKTIYNSVHVHPNGDLSSFEWNLVDREFDVTPSISTAQIYDHTLLGFKGDGSWSSYDLLTDIEDDRVNFVLDTPQTKSEFITIDE